ncbi:hypothetical protein HK097_000605 [Rhizophlyctis rosea]|uniref:EndoU domain-containing protein n=1 Tax=Rhizophlyctis rosea TaxID=64517 RepID=A0AAD5S757_9FUNG|nr:hypothetical protein HK097_000605 [Rhizophlyctis rosea]
MFGNLAKALKEEASHLVHDLLDGDKAKQQPHQQSQNNQYGQQPQQNAYPGSYQQQPQQQGYGGQQQHSYDNQPHGYGNQVQGSGSQPQQYAPPPQQHSYNGNQQSSYTQDFPAPQSQSSQPSGAWSQGPPPASSYQSSNSWSQGPPAHAPSQSTHNTYSSGPTHSAPQQDVSVPEPTQQELHSLREAVNKMWDLDTNRLEPGRDFVLNLQTAKRPFTDGDTTHEPLFQNLNPSIFSRLPTYTHFINLLDNYHAKAGVAEKIDDAERREQSAFLDSCLKTGPIKYAEKYLRAKGALRGDFKEMLNEIWFQLYRRQTQNDSSAFEHTFVGEVRDQKVIGFHNWIQFWNEERKGSANYHGYFKPRRTRGLELGLEESHVLSLQLAWHGLLKSISTFFIGTSPEFELALYTLVFLFGDECERIEIEEVEIDLKCYRHQGNKLGSVYPEAK